MNQLRNKILVLFGMTLMAGLLVGCGLNTPTATPLAILPIVTRPPQTATLSATKTPALPSAVPLSSSTAAGQPTRSPNATSTGGQTTTATPALTAALITTGAAGLPTRVPIQTARQSLGQVVTVQGTVSAVASYKYGFKFTLSDAQAAITLLLPSDVYRAVVGVADLRVGAVVRATGQVDVYNEETQVEPSAGAGVSVIQAAVMSQTVTPISQLSITNLGQTFTLRGQVRDYATFSAGLRMKLVDESGRIDLILWQNVAEFVPAVGLLPSGPVVLVTGTLGEYKGKLQLVPALGFDVQVVR